MQYNLTAKGKNVDELRVRVIAFRDFVADGEAALQESPFFRLPTRGETVAVCRGPDGSPPCEIELQDLVAPAEPYLESSLKLRSPLLFEVSAGSRGPAWAGRVPVYAGGDPDAAR